MISGCKGGGVQIAIALKTPSLWIMTEKEEPR